MQTLHTVLSVIDSDKFNYGLTLAVVALFGILMKKNQIQDKKLAECEVDRKTMFAQMLSQQKEITAQQKEITGVWRYLKTGKPDLAENAVK